MWLSIKFFGMAPEMIQQHYLGDVDHSFGSAMHEQFNATSVSCPWDLPIPWLTPRKFDWREKKAECVHPIRDQGSCGSCWSFATTEQLTDRFCIKSHKRVDTVLSPQYLVSCHRTSSLMGCQGAYTMKVFDVLEDTGTVSETCYPYTSGTT